MALSMSKLKSTISDQTGLEISKIMDADGYEVTTTQALFSEMPLGWRGSFEDKNGSLWLWDLYEMAKDDWAFQAKAV